MKFRATRIAVYSDGSPPLHDSAEFADFESALDWINASPATGVNVASNLRTITVMGSGLLAYAVAYVGRTYIGLSGSNVLYG
jgi:hypothetical protein